LNNSKILHPAGKMPARREKGIQWRSKMPGKIFYRERRKTLEGEKKPRYRAVAIADANIKIYSDHLRMSELEHIAEACGAELILLRKGDKKETAKSAEK
jgi:hypothetical protein